MKGTVQYTITVAYDVSAKGEAQVLKDIERHVTKDLVIDATGYSGDFGGYRYKLKSAVRSDATPDDQALLDFMQNLADAVEWSEDGKKTLKLTIVNRASVRCALTSLRKHVLGQRG